MCQAPLGKVIAVGNGSITVEYKGKPLVLDSRLIKVEKGDYVFFSGNIAVEQVGKEDAELLLDAERR